MNRAYAAGIIDGEGCIQFTHCRKSVYPRVLIVNTDLDLLGCFQRSFGGDINRLTLRKHNWKQGYTWRLSWMPAVEFLDKINPWLIVKRDQAVTAFAWSAIRPGRGGRWDCDALDLLKRRMTWLNAKGPPIGNDPILEAV